ncbi:MAG: hypothetical protein AAF688_04390 [Bacteroidota bacterium]
MKKSLLFISCEEAHHICDKSQYGEATGWERIKLGIRLSWCKITRAYTRKNNALTEAIKKSEVRALSPDELQDIEIGFQEHLKNQN